jgi:type I restriction enzyme R subunit
VNQNPEQFARDNIDKQLLLCGWVIQDKKQINLRAGFVGSAHEFWYSSANPESQLKIIY